MIFQLLFFNRCFDKNRLKSLISWSLVRFGEKSTIDLVEKLKDLGFYYATQAGVSLGIDDLKIPPTKPFLVSQAENQIQSTRHDYEKGHLTSVERFQKMIDTWHRTSETLRQDVVHNFRATDSLNPVFMMAFSGARGNLSQVRQLVAMRGLMADPQGQIIDFPIRSNFREGLTLTEYVISCYGARKGLVDTALRTANSGYLTRRLVDVSQHVIVRQLDCGTRRGLFLTEMRERKKVILSLQNRLIGRVLAEDIEPIAYRNQDISPELSTQIGKARTQVLVRSPLTCETKNSICQLCYGWSLAHGNLVSLGEAVGILAAQSIGEPGTQLTMRTFHTGGVFSGDLIDELRAPFDAQVSFSNSLQGMLIRTPHGNISFLTKMDGQLILTHTKNQTTVTYPIPASTVLFVRQGEFVKKKQLVAEISSTQTNQRIQSKYKIHSPLEGQIYFENVILGVKTGKDGDLTRIGLKLGSLWILSGKIYQSGIPATLFPRIGDVVNKTTIMNQSQFVVPYNGYLEPDSMNKIQISSLTRENRIQRFGPGKTTLNCFLPSGRKPSQFQLKRNHEDPDIILHQSILQLPLNKILYRGFSYFGSFSSPHVFRDSFFISCSLQTTELSINQFFLTWFQKKYTPPTGGAIYLVDQYLKDDFSSGEFFWVAESWYVNRQKKQGVENTPQGETRSSRIHTKKIQNARDLKKPSQSKRKSIEKINNQIVPYWVSKNHPLFSTKNKQGCEKIVYSQYTGLLDIFYRSVSNETSQLDSGQQTNVLISSKKIETNRIKKICRNPQSRFVLTKTDHFIEKDLTRIDGPHMDQPENRFLQNSTHLIDHPHQSQSDCTYQFRLKSGWMYVPKNPRKTFYVSNSIATPGQPIEENIVFDQHAICIEHVRLSPELFKKTGDSNLISSPKLIFKNRPIRRYQLSKPLSQKQSPFFENPLFSQFQSDTSKRINGHKGVSLNSRDQNSSIYGVEPVLCDQTVSQKSRFRLVSVLGKNRKNYSILSSSYQVTSSFVGIDDTRNHRDDIEKGLNRFNKKHSLALFTQKVSSIQYHHVKTLISDQSQIGIFFRKSVQYVLSDAKTVKNQFLGFTSQNQRRDSLNKQHKSELIYQFAGVDLELQFPSFQKKFFFQRKYKNSLCLIPVFLAFSASKSFPFKTANLKLTWDSCFHVSVQKKLTISHSSEMTNPVNETDVFVQKGNRVVEKTPLTVTSFFSPYEGEISHIKSDSVGKQKSVILTKQDQISFSTYGFNPLVSVGQFLRYGDQFIDQHGVTESGQIIQLDQNRVTLRKGYPILFSPRTIFHVHHGDCVEKNSPILTLFYQRLKTGDIVQGIPKIEELFEARQTKEGDSLQDNVHTKLGTFFEFYKQSFSSQEAARISIEKIQQILVNGVQQVYQSQGVTIADKHIEIVVRQMTSKVKIVESGQTGLLRGELIDLQWIEMVNLGIESQNQLFYQGVQAQKAEYEPMILGITKASLETESFISAASFQETTRILSRAAIERKTDFLRGLKENVILGHLIPAGTGFSLSFDPQIKVSGVLMNLSWLNYKDIAKFFPRRDSVKS
jgi:hypothetical protein